MKIPFRGPGQTPIKRPVLLPTSKPVNPTGYWIDRPIKDHPLPDGIEASTPWPTDVDKPVGGK
tara:strand:- start:2636 stop:2824 length:189 start_codon:yes stop_codon:yes gene_type:complete